MARPGRTQKQIAERYKSNLGYYNKIHPWRRARRLVSLLTIFGTIAGIWFFSKFGRENKNEVFTPTDEPHGQIEAVVTRDE